MISQIVIEIETDDKNKTIGFKLNSYIRKYSSDEHKEAVNALYRRIDKLITEARR